MTNHKDGYDLQKKAIELQKQERINLLNQRWLDGEISTDDLYMMENKLSKSDAYATKITQPKDKQSNRLLLGFILLGLFTIGFETYRVFNSTTQSVASTTQHSAYDVNHNDNKATTEHVASLSAPVFNTILVNEITLEETLYDSNFEKCEQQASSVKKNYGIDYSIEICMEEITSYHKDYVKNL
jgi:hypothetical protein